MKCTAIFLIAASFPSVVKADEAVEYGLDVSFAQTSEHVNTTVQVLGDRKKVYEDYIQGCRDYWVEKSFLCDASEGERFNRNIVQPQSMVNYTDVGYKKIRAPEHVFKMITEFWEANKNKESDEQLPEGNSFLNYWENAVKMVSVENTDLDGGGTELYDSILKVTRELISEWVGQELEGSSVYGIRIYKEGSILAPHVDRLPLISSAIINVAQDVDEAWPLEVIGHDGIAHNVTMEPGDLVLYESHSIIHSRPFALKGRYFANIFIHFMPFPSDDQIHNNALPPYIQEGSKIANEWNLGEFEGVIPGAPRRPALLTDEQHSNDVTRHYSHTAAAQGNVQDLMRIANEEKEALFAKDKSGWEPIHEAVRSGSKDAIEFLVKHGADLNSKTMHGDGDSPLDIAVEENHDDDFITWLRSLGATVTIYDSDEL